MADYSKFSVGDKNFYRFGAYDIEEGLARRGVRYPILDEYSRTTGEFGFLENENETQRALYNISVERANRAAYAADQGLTTGSQTSYKNTRSRMGTSILTGGGRATGSSLTRGRKASAMLGA